MNIRESSELNREVRSILKTLDVKWGDGGAMLTVSNKIVGLLLRSVEREYIRNQSIIESIKELVND
jgi:hypothetical protein